MKLYFNPRSRAITARWMLEECGADYALVHIDMAGGEHKGDAFRTINPAGKLPALVDGDARLYENTAICLYLAERFPKARLAPDLGDPERGKYLTMAIYATSQLEPAVSDSLLKVETHSARGWTDTQTALAVVAKELGGGPYLLGEQFTAADVLVGATLWWYGQFGGGALPGALADYIDRIRQRPAAAVLSSMG